MFRTEISLEPSAYQINHQDSCLSLGSCFADMVGRKLGDNKFTVQSNPMGILYNPVSLHKVIGMALSGDSPDPTRVTRLHERSVHYDFHSEVNAPSDELLIEKLEDGLGRLKSALISANWLIITYGTSMVHSLNKDVVANCHKQPARLFEKHMATIDQMLDAARNSIDLLHSHNPELRIICSVSPIRHARETLPVNSVSKSRLRVLCDSLSSEYDQVAYFPGYEIMTDDLRDYRFYSSDLIHPSAVAEDYIWNKFTGQYFSEATRSLCEKWQGLRKNLLHRPFNRESEDHKKFLEHTLKKLEQLGHELPLSEEISEVKRQLHRA